MNNVTNAFLICSTALLGACVFDSEPPKPDPVADYSFAGKLSEFIDWNIDHTSNGIFDTSYMLKQEDKGRIGVRIDGFYFDSTRGINGCEYRVYLGMDSASASRKAATAIVRFGGGNPSFDHYRFDIPKGSTYTDYRIDIYCGNRQ